MLIRTLTAAALLAVCFAMAGAGAQEPPREDVTPQAGTAARRAIEAMEAKGWTLAFHDEFEGKALDTSRWIDSYPDNVRTHSNNEQQYYATDGYLIDKGLLRLKAERRS